MTRRLLDGSPDLTGHRRRHGPVPYHGKDALVGALEAAGLTGRGGAGFPTHRKLAAVGGAGRRVVVVANAAEGEPASAKDRALLAANPHLVLDGLRIAADALGTRALHLYLGARADSGPVAAALAERAGSGYDRAGVAVHTAPDTFVAGEESAVVAAIEGRPPVPADKARPVFAHGVGGAPTLVLNVETLAHLALVARYGPAWFRAAGTADEPGTFLVTVGGAVREPGVREVPYGVPLGDVVIPAAPVRAVLAGGYHGTWAPLDPRIPLSRAGLAAYGATPGAGVVSALDARRCPLDAAARVVAYLAGQSAGQCGPCLNGLPRLAETFGALARGHPQQGEVARLAGLVAGRGACHHPDGAVRFVASTLSFFADDVAAHLAGRCVAAGVR